MPSVAVHCDVFSRLVASTVSMRGMPQARQVFIPTPVLNQSRPELRAYIEGIDPVHGRPFVDELLGQLTRPLAEDALRGTEIDRSVPRLLEPDTDEHLHALFADRRWTDFLPIVLPTEARVERMLAGTSHARDELVGQFGRPGAAWTFDVEKVAVNAVMAGAAPEHLAVILALASSGDTARNGSMSNMGRMAVVNGPIRSELAMNAGIGAMGPYNYANAAIGRAYGLLSQNLQGGSVPGISYHGPQGNNLSYNNCTFAENEEQSPFEPYHVRQGFSSDESTVTVLAVWGVVWSEHLRSRWPQKLEAMLAGLEPYFGITFVLSPIAAREFVDRGLKTPDEIAAWVHENVKIPAARYWDHITNTLIHPQVEAGVEPYATYRKADPEALIPIFEPDRVSVVVTGGTTNGTFDVFMGSPRRPQQGSGRGATVSVDAWR